MRVLFVTHRFPGAAHRGDQARAMAQIEALAQRHEVHVLCFDQPAPNDPAWTRLRPRCASLTTYPRPRLMMLVKAALALLRDRPLQVAMFDARSFNHLVRRLIDQHRIELVHVQLVRLAGVIEQRLPVPIVLDFVDALSRNMAARAAQESWRKRWLFELEAKRLLRLERALLPKLAGAVISASADAADIDPGQGLTVAANGVHLPLFDAVPEPALRDGLVFLGNWAYFPNQQGLLWLIEQVMPRLWAAFPSLQLTLVGANPDAIPAAARLPRVRILGAVASVAPILKEAAIALAPMQTGSGQSLKILEAMAAATPVVASVRAASALAAVTVDECCVADDAAAFAEAVSCLLRDPAKARQIGQAGRQYVATHYDWQISHQQLAHVWERAVARG